jgi:hypothetical protein
MAGVAFAVEGDGVGFATESYAASALYTTLASLSGALWRIRWASYKADKVWYDRCNFSGHLVHCVLINYPAEEERAWDDVVTRISLSLSGK